MDAPSAFRKRKERPSDLCAFFSEQDRDVVRPQLRLIQIQSHYSPTETAAAVALSLNISRRVFHDLFSLMRANPWVLWLLSSKYDGFHYVKAQDGRADTFFFGVYHSALIWTFDPITASTKVLLVSRRYSRQEEIYLSLDRWARYLSTPYVPLIATALGTVLDFDDNLGRYVSYLVSVEKGTGFSGFTAGKPDIKFDVDRLAEWSRVSSNVQINVINIIRHHNNCMLALDTIRERYGSDTPNAKYKEEYERSMAQILESIRVLKMRADSFVSYATYVKNRAEAQISVVNIIHPLEISLMVGKACFNQFNSPNYLIRYLRSSPTKTPSPTSKPPRRPWR
jgi:hypothetical protein